MFSFLPSGLAAQGTLLLDSPQRHNISPYVQILEDTSGNLSISDITSPPYSQQFETHSSKRAPNFSYTESAIWLRFDIRILDESQNWVLEINYPLLNQVDFYAPDGEGGFMHQQSGNAFPFGIREIEHRNPVLAIPSSPGQQTVYIRVKTQSAMVIPAAIWERGSFISHVQREYILLGIYYGLIFLVFIYFFLLYILGRIKNYFYYLFYIANTSLFIFIFNGLAFQYLWPNHPWWAQHSLALFIIMATFSSILFTFKVLPIKKHSPALGKILITAAIMAACLAPLSLMLNFTLAMQIGIYSVAAAAIIVIYSTVTCWRKGYRPARFILLSWLLLALGVVLMSGRSLGFLPDSFITMYGLQIGFTFQIIFITIGLADHVRRLHKQEELVKEKNSELELERQKLQHVKMLNRVSQEISFQDDYRMIINKILLYIKKQVYYDYGCFLEKRGHGFIVMACCSQESGPKHSGQENCFYDENIFHQSIQQQKALIISPTENIAPLKSFPLEAGSRSVMVVPLLCLDKYSGIIVLESKSHTFSKLESSMVVNFAGLACTKIEGSHLFRKMKMLSIKDELTGLYNRRYLFSRGKQELSKARRYNSPLSVVILDIDDFKKINDSYGHAAGDLVLEILAQKCLEALRSIDVACRYKGEELVLLLPETGPQDAKIVAERLRKVIASTPVTLKEGQKLNITASFGISCFTEDIVDFEMLLDRADRALLEAKGEGKNITKVKCKG